MSSIRQNLILPQNMVNLNTEGNPTEPSSLVSSLATLTVTVLTVIIRPGLSFRILSLYATPRHIRITLSYLCKAMLPERWCRGRRRWSPSPEIL